MQNAVFSHDMAHLTPLAVRGGGLELILVGNPEDGISRVSAEMVRLTYRSQLNTNLSQHNRIIEIRWAPSGNYDQPAHQSLLFVWSNEDQKKR